MEKNVSVTRKLDFCLSCEICLTACPVGAIEMEYQHGQFLPRVNEKCNNCSTCLELCPGIEIDPFNLRSADNLKPSYYGADLGSYIIHSKNSKIRENSTSGGIVTTLICELVKNQDYDTAFVLKFNKFNEKPARLEATSDVAVIYESAGSKYIPASVHDILLTIQEDPQKRYVVIGTPCQIQGMKKFLAHKKISEDKILFLGLFCDKTLNYNIIRYYEDKYKKDDEKISKFRFRTKKSCGWPGNSSIVFSSDRKIMVDRKVRMNLKKYFQLNRCLFCLSGKLNPQADISMGDCYIPGQADPYGKSNIIIRTTKGKKVIEKYQHLFDTQKTTIDDIALSQGLAYKTEIISFVKLFYNLHSTGDQFVSGKIRKSQKYLKWGALYQTRKISIHNFFSRHTRKLKNITSILLTGIVIFLNMTYHAFFRLKKEKKEKSNIIITGGGFSNKGAQAMTFTTVDQINRRFPDKSIYLLSHREFTYEGNHPNPYNFSIIPWSFGIKLVLLGLPIKLISSTYLDHVARIKNILENTDICVDISGYSLSSKWGFITSLDYLLNIMVARKFSISHHILPQSIGPFRYSLTSKLVLYPLMKLYLKYPEKIWVREKEGINYIQKFTHENVTFSQDIVLQKQKYDMSNIYKNPTESKKIKLQPSAVGIIPNFKVFQLVKPQEFYKLYERIIRQCIESGKTVYILSHSYEDLPLCEKMKDIFQKDEQVILIRDELNAIELEYIIEQLDFVVASRYHSLVHSYRNGVPALVIGWATKYHELMESFHQLDYYFDVRDDFDSAKLKSALKKMISDYGKERKVLENNINHHHSNVFDHLPK